MPHTCLVVSDDEVFTVLRELLSNDKRALFHAPTGAAALDWLSERRGPTIVLADLPLADVSGSELIESVRCDAELARRVAVVCLVGAGVRVPPRALRVVRKPATARALLGAVADARRQLAAGSPALAPAVVAPARF